ncbi:NAD-dependent protein deacylase Sirt4 [Cylas formicarius]|uniref:NAD-dependent protein deacylase Sirt4 n=1 Tax=Cylas formicarius TaxID=197179 RepID=UPI0029588AD1|nr:NAD-dependent protein deacylase Sirt4 [Cylas formicarius]
MVLKKNFSQFVPNHKPVNYADIEKLKSFISSSQKLLVLTGAGISTESGIPDYRSKDVGLYARTNHKPITHQEFLKSDVIRQGYWARNFVGWDRFSRCVPNIVHYTLKDLEMQSGKISVVVTQNVDNLHFKAGSENVIELHGSGFRVLCLKCGSLFSRHYIQEKLLKVNGKVKNISKMIRPDGDVEIPEMFVKTFIPPMCELCGGILKPDIIFFGDNVPKSRVDLIRYKVAHSDSLLVLGSSLSTFSGYRIVLQALEEKKNMAIVNIGPTRADDCVQIKIEAKCGDILHKVVDFH